MPVTKHGPASITVTRSTWPSSGSKTCVMPIFLPRSPAIALDQLDLDVDARRKVIETLERVHRLRRGLKDVDQPLVRADLEVLARVLVLERRANHAVDVLLGRQWHRTGDARAGARSRLDDLLGGRLDRRVVVRLQADADLVLGQCCHEKWPVLPSTGRAEGGPCAGPAPVTSGLKRRPYWMT